MSTKSKRSPAGQARSKASVQKDADKSAFDSKKAFWWAVLSVALIAFIVSIMYSNIWIGIVALALAIVADKKGHDYLLGDYDERMDEHIRKMTDGRMQHKLTEQESHALRVGGRLQTAKNNAAKKARKQAIREGKSESEAEDAAMAAADAVTVDDIGGVAEEIADYKALMAEREGKGSDDE